MRSHADLSTTLTLKTLGIELPIAEIYESVEFVKSLS